MNKIQSIHFLLLLVILSCSRIENETELTYEIFTSVNNEFIAFSNQVIYLDSNQLEIGEFEVSNCYFNDISISNDSIYFKHGYHGYVHGEYIQDYTGFENGNLVDTNSYLFDSTKINFQLSKFCGIDLKIEPTTLEKSYLFISKPAFNNTSDKALVTCYLNTNRFELNHILYLEKMENKWTIKKHTVFLNKIAISSPNKDGNLVYYMTYLGVYNIR